MKLPLWSEMMRRIIGSRFNVSCATSVRQGKPLRMSVQPAQEPGLLPSKFPNAVVKLALFVLSLVRLMVLFEVGISAASSWR